jgi:C-terminal processing protease CtpA/Prc
MTQSDRLKVIYRIKEIVFSRHFNAAGVNYSDWSRAIEVQLPVLLRADDKTFEDGIRNLLRELRSSHTNFYRSDTQPALPQHAIGATFSSVSYNGAARWMVLDVFDQSPAARAGLKPGQFLQELDNVRVAPPAFPVFRFGHEHRLTLECPWQGKPRNLILNVPARKQRLRRLPLVEPSSVTHHVVGSIGMLKIPFFSGAFGIRFSKLLDRAIHSIKAQGCNRLIIDLRGCLGGSLGFARLASYMCPNRIPIGYDVTRTRLQRGYDIAQLPRVSMPRSRIGLLFCLARFSLQDKSLVLLTQGLGNQPFHGRIVVLVNEWTNSAGEIVAQFATDTKLAIVVGKQTRGNVLGSTTFDVGDGYRLYLPIFGWYGPNGNSSEGYGVQPDVSVDVNPDRLCYGSDAQFEKALEILQ